MKNNPNALIKQMEHRVHLLERPGMYIQSIVPESYVEFILNKDRLKFILEKREYIAGLVKIFNEVIDNAIDEFIKTKGKYANKISVKMTDDYFEVQDNGRGIPNTKMVTLSGDEKYQAEVAFTEMLSGGNYENPDEATLGTYGVGSKATSVYSKKTIIYNDDGNSRLKITTENNMEIVKTEIQPSKKQGVYFKAYPDLDYFNIDKIDETHKNLIEERLYHLSIVYPEITFKFNNKTIRLNPKKYFEMFDIKDYFVTDKYMIGITNSESDQFEHFSLVNGLVTSKGGNHINIISNDIVKPIREKLQKKYKTIKPGDIKQKLRLVVIFNDFMSASFTSQTKVELSSSEKEIREYLGNEYKDKLFKFINKILRNQDIILPITELFRLKEQAKENTELKKLNKTKKKIKSEKYLPATKKKKILFLCEGASAVGGLVPSLGREEYGFYELKGVPLNAYDSNTQKFTANKELSELYQIVQNEFATYYEDNEGEWIKIKVGNKEIIANTNDEILINGKWISVEEML